MKIYSSFTFSERHWADCTENLGSFAWYSLLVGWIFGFLFGLKDWVITFQRNNDKHLTGSISSNLHIYNLNCFTRQQWISTVLKPLRETQIWGPRAIACSTLNIYGYCRICNGYTALDRLTDRAHFRDMQYQSRCLSIISVTNKTLPPHAPRREDTCFVYAKLSA